MPESMAAAGLPFNARMYHPELDGLRFLAFVAVFIHHAPDPLNPAYESFRLQTWVGVDIFLCLSAFLFAHLLEAEWRQTGGIHVFHFYIRRALRIWPVYFLYVALITVVIFFQQGAANSGVARILSSLTFTNNILDAVSGYDYAQPVILLLHLWSISYEEQFYLVIPWFLRLIFRKNQKDQILILAGIFLTGLVIRMGFISLNIPFPAVYVLPITHFEPVLLGLVIGLGLFRSFFERFTWASSALAAGGCFFLVSLLPYYKVNSGWLLITYILVGLGSSALLLMALKSAGVPAMRWLSSRPIVYLGKISYGLYLYHYGCLYFIRWLLAVLPSSFAVNPGLKAPLVFFLALGLTILLAALSYRFIEKPFLRLKEKYTTVAARPI
jgi:peptidoglycan/LPS O-acetylase OafA/YrhL